MSHQFKRYFKALTIKGDRELIEECKSCLTLEKVLAFGGLHSSQNGTYNNRTRKAC